MTLGVFNSPNLVRGCFGKQLVMVTRVFSRLYGSKFVSLKIRRSGSSFSDLQSQLYNFFFLHRTQYDREQELYNNKALLSKESKERLELNFMYEPPPGTVPGLSLKQKSF